MLLQVLSGVFILIGMVCKYLLLRELEAGIEILTWPTPYLPQLPTLPMWRHFACIALSIAFLLVQVRVMLYYS